MLVDLHYTSRPMYRELIAAPPVGVEYVDHSLYVEDAHIAPVRVRDRLADAPIVGTVGAYLYHAGGRPQLAGAGDLAHLCNAWAPLKQGYVVDFENCAALTDSRVNRLRSGLYKRMVEKYLAKKSCVAIVPYTRFAANGFYRNFNSTIGLVDKIHSIYPAIRPSKYEWNGGGDVVNLLFVGFSWGIKRGNDLLDAYAIIRNRFEVALTVVSNAPPDARERMKHLGISYYRFVPNEELHRDIYPNTDIFVLPSVCEGLGFSYLEAMSHQLPIVASNIGHMSEMIHPEGGFLVKPDRPTYDKRNMPLYGKDDLINEHWPHHTKQLVEALTELIENDSQRRSMGRYNRGLVERTGAQFNIEHRNNLLREIYEVIM